jgi:UDP-N-acetylglucosamine--N-acetylmuramyl-(pentapeptide) pyrophosphoryl-undecaprenol N-acetylglucosamine transferase
MKQKDNLHIIISGGGTGGHVFPAIAIADALKTKHASIKILFVGAKGRMEMEKVPQAGYEIIGLPVTGIQRKLSFRNIAFMWNLLRSMIKSRRIIASFKPDAVVGVGGYASYPVLRAANRKGIPTFIQEQNSYAGLTNRLLSRKAQKIFVAYDEMDKYFPKQKIIKTGNPVRQIFAQINNQQIINEAYEYFKLNKNKKTLLIVGGSLGARTINRSVEKHMDKLLQSGFQVIWQTGKYYYEDIISNVSGKINDNIKILNFISRMDLAFAAANLIITRAGALSVSEISLAALPAIFVPSPNVAEDHQTKNAQALEKNNAAVLIKDKEAAEKLIPKAIELMEQQETLKMLSENIYKMATKDAANQIVKEILKTVS